MKDMSNPDLQAVAELERLVADALLADRGSLQQHLHRLRQRLARKRPIDRSLARLRTVVEASAAAVRHRAGLLPVIDYPESLPVTACRQQISAAIDANQVVVVCGETGSGKTTQLPKICLQMGRGIRGWIGHTQPRRIAARAMAARIAEELGSEPGKLVGHKVRFTDQVGPDTLVKLMTDGILLAEIHADPALERYDTLILDEAHERSLNIDFLLGYLHHLLPRRPDLKLIITSATIDPLRFSRHFGDAPVINVSGRGWPVETRYRPLVSDHGDEDRSRIQGIVDAVDELASSGPGDVLVFLSGEREIRETAEALRKHHPPHTEILPLYARLSAAEQNRVFRPHRGRRIVLATNVAETSLTVPGIRYVVDPGLARISRYSVRSKVQRLAVEPVSQASAAQRAGRCGRTSAGVCIRLYSEQDFESRDPFTEPEILRTNLAAVVLQMLDLGLGDIERFPFIDPPDSRQIKDAFRLLLELGAVSVDRRINELGRKLARLPIDPRLGRMVLAAEEHGALSETMVIAAALSTQDPRERPLDARQQADRCHARFADPGSDFLSLLNLWRYFHEQARHLSANKLRKLCRSEFLSWTRMREWQDVHRQILTQVKGGGGRLNQEPAGFAELHLSLLAGLLDQVGSRDHRDGYQGPRDRRFYLFPGSGLSKRRPRWLMAAELVETSRLFARTVAAVEPAWIEKMAAHLVRRHYGEPRWEQRSGRVRASETVTLYGLTIVTGRAVDYARIDPVAARGIFVREALVAGHYHSSAAFLAHNRGLLDEVVLLEAKSRRPDILIDAGQLFEFYDRSIPAQVTGAVSFERWYRHALKADPKLLLLSREALMRRSAAEVNEQTFPDILRVAGMALPLSYHFEPGDPADGVTVTVPAAVIGQLDTAQFEWLVPGLIEEKVVALIRTLPKSLRRNFVPVPEYARVCLESMVVGRGSLLSAMAADLKRVTGVSVDDHHWRPQALADHLQMRFRVVDDAGEELASGRRLDELRSAHAGGNNMRPQRPVAEPGLQENLRDWDFGCLGDPVEIHRAGIQMQGFPALVDDVDSVSIRILESLESAQQSTRRGVKRLLRLRLGGELAALTRNAVNLHRMCLHYVTFGTCKSLQTDLQEAILEHAFLATAPLPVDRGGFEAMLQAGRQGVAVTAGRLCALVAEILRNHHGIDRELRGGIAPAMLAALGDARSQMRCLVYPGFVAELPLQRLERLPRYLKALRVRLDKLRVDPSRDRERMLIVAPLWADCLARLERNRQAGSQDPELERYRWMLEEYRISLFAQEVGTGERVSGQRLARQWSKVV